KPGFVIRDWGFANATPVPGPTSANRHSESPIPNPESRISDMSVIALPKATANLNDLVRIPAVRQLGLLALLAVAIALGLWLFFWSQKPDFVPVQAGLDPKSTAEASDLLRSARIPFKLDPATGALAVPLDQVGEARMALAVAGLPASQGNGFETIQGDQGFGTSQF